MASSALGPFIVEFVKALLRTNYYSAEHQEARRSVTGLFERWRAAVPDGELRLFALRRQEEDESIVVSAPELPALANFGKSVAEERLVAALSDPDPEVGSTAIESLARLGSRRMDVLEKYQSTLLDRTAPPEMRAASATALTRLGAAALPGGKKAEGVLIDCLRQLPTGLKALLHSLTQAEQELYVAVCTALGSVGTPACVGALETVSANRNAAVRDSARAALQLVRSRSL